MSISTYAELQTAVGRWLQRTDLTAMIPDFIALAEADFNRNLRVSGQVTRADVAASSRWTDVSGLTDSLVEIKSISTTSGGVRFPLEYIAPDASQQFNTSGSPRYWTRIGDEIGVFPPPDGTYTLELIYYAKVPALSDSATTNFLLVDAPDVYLYRSVIEGANYTHNTDLLARVAPMYGGALQALINDDRKRQNGAGGLRMMAR